MVPKGKSRRKWEMFAGALLREPTIERAALSVGFSKRTGLRLLQDPAFAEEFGRVKRQVLETATAKLRGAASIAVETLASISRNPRAKAHARVAASIAILRFCLEAETLEDLERRIHALESQSNEPNL